MVSEAQTKATQTYPPASHTGNLIEERLNPSRRTAHHHGGNACVTLIYLAAPTLLANAPQANSGVMVVICFARSSNKKVRTV